MNINYICSGDYLIPDVKLPEETRPIGKWGRMHRDYLKKYHPVLFNTLALSGNLWTYLSDLNEQAQQAHGNLDCPNAVRRGYHRNSESCRSHRLGPAHE